jgi:hypothetical protein
MTGPGLLVVARGIAGSYETSEQPLLARRLGCFAVKRGDRLGTRYDPDELGDLRRAVTTALLDVNPSNSKGPASVAWTSDNSLLYGHNMHPGSSLSVEYGAMARTLVSGYRVGVDVRSVPRPVELHFPLMAPDFDSEYATAVYQVLRRGNDLSARLGRAVDWLDLAWRNTTSIDPDLRIIALHSGFEVLLGKAGDEDRRDKHLYYAAALSKLLDAATVTKPVRHWTKKRSGRPTSAPLSDLEWWFVKLTFLRNDVAHGLSVPGSAYGFNGEHHVMLGERRLRAAIRAKVCARRKWLRLDPFRRKFARAWEREERRMRTAGSGPPES